MKETQDLILVSSLRASLTAKNTEYAKNNDGWPKAFEEYTAQGVGAIFSRKTLKYPGTIPVDN